MVSPSLLVGRADDPAERQADAMADAALASLAGAGQPHSGVVSRSPAAGDQLGGLAVAAPVQREIDTARGGGSALGQREVSMFSGAYGVDLSPVRVHTDSRADGLSRSLQAHAFTTGSDVFFRNGTYKPGTESGDRLIGHELAHVATEGGAARRSMAPIRRWGWPSSWFGGSNLNGVTEEQKTEAAGTLLPTTGGAIDLAKDAPAGIDKAGLVAGDVGKNLGIAGGAFGLAGGAFQAGLGIRGGIDDYNRYNHASAHAIDKGLAWRSGKDNAKATVEGMGSIAMGGLAIGEAAGHAAVHGAQAVPGLGIAVSGLTFGQGLWRSVQHGRTRATLSNLTGKLKTTKAKERWLPVIYRKYGKKMGADIAKTIVGGLGIAVGAIALTGLMATPVGWGLAGAALAAGAIYGGVKAYKMYQEHQKKKAFADNGEAVNIDGLRTSVEGAQNALDTDRRNLLTMQGEYSNLQAELAKLDNNDENNSESIKYKNKEFVASKDKLEDLERILREATESNQSAQDAHSQLADKIATEEEGLATATAEITRAADAAATAKQEFAKAKQEFAKAKQEFANVLATNLAVLQALKKKVEIPPRTNSDPPSKRIADIAFWHSDQKLSEDKNSIETRKTELDKQRLGLADLQTTKETKAGVVLTAQTNMNNFDTAKHAMLLRILEAANRRKTQLEDQLDPAGGAPTPGLITKKDKEIKDLQGANGTGGTIAINEANLTAKMGEENKKDRYASGKGTTHIVAYEMAKAIKANQDQQILSLTLENELQQNITDEGKDAKSIAEAINITDDQLIPSNSTAKADPLLIELIETKLSLSKSM